MRLVINVNDDRVEWLLTEAAKFGFARVRPSKPWSEAERREAARFVIEKLVDNSLAS